MSNDRARKWLGSIGYEAEPEPAWVVSGQKPDFFAVGEYPMWVEVKTLDPPANLLMMDRAYSDLKERCSKLAGLTGDLYVVVSNEYDVRAAKWILGHLSRCQAAVDDGAFRSATASCSALFRACA